MAKKSKDRDFLVGRQRTAVNDLGRLVAEEDNRLQDYYVQAERYVHKALSVSDPVVFYMGPKGVGKSAILQMVRLAKKHDARRVIEISPDDLAFSSLANIDLDTPILASAATTQWLFQDSMGLYSVDRDPSP